MPRYMRIYDRIENFLKQKKVSDFFSKDLADLYELCKRRSAVNILANYDYDISRKAIPGSSCPVCGNIVLVGDNYCCNCGKRVKVYE